MHGRKAEHDIADRTVGSRRRSAAHVWALLAALALCVGQTVGDTHVHLDEHEEDACTVCAICDPGHVPQTGPADAQLPEWRRSGSLPVYSAAASPSLYQAAKPRAPPFSVS